jgi:2-polyprenyl-3-methyl-5-hydroxy-6-metoxy-1,4-benzoquinol methylase
MTTAPREDAQTFWENFSRGRAVLDDAQLAGLALYGNGGIYDAYRDRAERIAVSALIPNPDANWRVLDLGCGPGRWTVPFARACREVVAIDFSRAMLDHAHRRCQAANVADKVKFIERGIESLDTEALGKFDLVLVMGVLQFVPDEQLDGVVAEIAKCLTPGALLLHRETRTRSNWQKEYQVPGESVTMRSHYKTFEHYRDSFAIHCLKPLARRSVLPPNLLYSIYNRLWRNASDGSGLRTIIALHENAVDPLWRMFPRLLWHVNSRRATDMAAVLYQRRAT